MLSIQSNSILFTSTLHKNTIQEKISVSFQSLFLILFCFLCLRWILWEKRVKSCNTSHGWTILYISFVRLNFLPLTSHSLLYSEVLYYAIKSDIDWLWPIFFDFFSLSLLRPFYFSCFRLSDHTRLKNHEYWTNLHILAWCSTHFSAYLTKSIESFMMNEKIGWKKWNTNQFTSLIKFWSFPPHACSFLPHLFIWLFLIWRTKFSQDNWRLISQCHAIYCPSSKYELLVYHFETFSWSYSFALFDQLEVK